MSIDPSGCGGHGDFDDIRMQKHSDDNAAVREYDRQRREEHEAFLERQRESIRKISERITNS